MYVNKKNTPWTYPNHSSKSTNTTGNGIVTKFY